jgi:transposase InsO family protein
MPWKETEASKERVKFILEWERRWNACMGGRMNLTELAREFGVHRDTAHVWVRRYKESGFRLEAMQERSRRPHTSPTAVDSRMQDFVVDARKVHPTWGPRKLRAWLVERHPGVPFPSASCMADILKRCGLTQPRRRRKRFVTPRTRPFATCERPNDVWCIDFKGKFRTQDGKWCHVLTLVDAYSRFLLRCEAVLDPDGRQVEHICDSAFLEFGLPAAMRSDNGPPFASTGAGGLTRLSVWWLRLGIRLDRIEPGKPQQNGRQERLHSSLEEVVASPSKNIRSQQRALDLWRCEYNNERPHEALGQHPPTSAYHRSERHYPRKLLRPDPDLFNDVEKVDKHGFIRWRRTKIFISSALGYEPIEIAPDGPTCTVSYGSIVLGELNAERLNAGLKPKRGLSEISLG